MSKRRITITIDAQATYCGACEFLIGPRYDLTCDLFRDVDALREPTPSGKRSPRCLAAERRAKEGGGK